MSLGREIPKNHNFNDSRTFCVHVFQELRKILSKAHGYVTTDNTPRLFSLQGICTPQEGNILYGLMAGPSDLLQMAAQVTPKVMEFLGTLRHPHDIKAAGLSGKSKNSPEALPSSPYCDTKCLLQGGCAYVNIVMIDGFRSTELTQWCVDWNRKFR